MATPRSGFQPRTTPAERRADLDLHRLIGDLTTQAVPLGYLWSDQDGLARVLGFGFKADSGISGWTPRLWRPKYGAVFLGDEDEIPGKFFAHGAVYVNEVNDTPEVIGRRCEGQFVDGQIFAETALAAEFERGVDTTITCVDLKNGTVTWRDTGYVLIQDTGSGMALFSYSSINRAAGTISGLTLLRSSAGTTVFAAGCLVSSVNGPNTNLLLIYGQSWMGKGGYQERSAQIAVFTADFHAPDGYGGYDASGYLQFTTSAPGPGSTRRTQMTLDEAGRLALHGSGLLDRTTMSKRFQVAPKNTRANGSFTLPVTEIAALDPSGFPAAGQLAFTSAGGAQVYAYTAIALNTTTGKWEFTGCTSVSGSNTGTVADQAFLQIPKTTVSTVISTLRGNIAAQDDGTNDTVEMGKVGPTTADKEAGIKIGGSSGACTIYRFGSAEMATSQIMRFIASGSTPGWKVAVAGEAEPRVSCRVAGVFFGPGSSTAVDSSLRRVAANEVAVRDAGDSTDGTIRINVVRLGASGPIIAHGTGSPESVLTAKIGSTYHREDGGAGTSFYVKESGTGNTGWVAK